MFVIDFELSLRFYKKYIIKFCKIVDKNYFCIYDIKDKRPWRNGRRVRLRGVWLTRVSSSLTGRTKKSQQVLFAEIFLSIAIAMVYHHRRCISSDEVCISYRNDDMQHSVLMIYNFYEIDDMQGFALMFFLIA